MNRNLMLLPLPVMSHGSAYNHHTAYALLVYHTKMFASTKNDGTMFGLICCLEAFESFGVSAQFVA